MFKQRVIPEFQSSSLGYLLHQIRQITGATNGDLEMLGLSSASFGV